MRGNKLLFLAAAGLILMGCSVEEPDVDSGAGGTDAGPSTGTDAGPSTGTDSGPMTGTDAGPSDSCAASDTDAISTVGCNGGIYGSTEMDNQIGGACTPDGTPMMPGPGTCTAGASGTMAICAADEDGATTGRCLYTCPSATDYVSNGACPSGSRCFNLGDFSLCFRDCNSASDCFADEMCDSEGSCVPVPMDGGAMMGTDAGPMMGSDAGVPMADAG